MSRRRVNNSVIGVGILSSLSVIATALLGAESIDQSIAAETFNKVAEKSLWAALAITLTIVSVMALLWLARFCVLTMAEVIDDNTFSNLHICNIMSKRPCLHDSDFVIDAKAIEEDSGPIGDTGRRVIARRKDRASRHAN